MKSLRICLAALVGGALLTGCAQIADQAAEASAGGDCAAVDSLHLNAQRSSFSLDFPSAERRLREILSLYASEPALTRCHGVSAALAHGKLGLALSSQRKFRLADAAFAEAVAAVENAAAEGATQERLDLDRGRLGALRSQHALNVRDYEAARRDSEAALALLRDAFDQPIIADGDLVAASPDATSRRISGITGLYSRSAALARLGRVEEARRSIDEALREAGALQGGTDALRSRLLIERALLEIYAGRPEDAVEPARQAAAQLDVELGDTPLAARARLVEGAALAATRQREPAFAAFSSAFSAYADYPAALSFEALWPYFKLAIESAASGAIDEATMSAGVFEAAQLVRSASAASDIAQNVAQFEAGDSASASAVRAWRAAQDELFLISSALSRRDLAAFERESLNKRFVDAARREDRLRARRDELAPQFAEAIERPVTLAQVQAALQPGEALLQILTGQPRSLLILIEPDSVRVRTTRIDGLTAGAIVQSLRDATRRRPDGVYPGFNTAGAHLVYDQLLRDLGPLVAKTPTVFVAANGALQGLPFEMLVASDPTAQNRAVARGDYTGVDWLGAHTAFNYLPSARNLVDLRAARPAGGALGDVIAFGDFDPGADAASAVDARRRQSCAAEVNVIRSLPRLPGTRAELARVRAAFGADRSETVTGDAFTEGRVKALSQEGRLSGYRILHFATHGLLWPTVDCFDPALTASAEPDGGEDGLLESGEIRGLALDADLVVLSACESTDVAVNEAGENLSGLARAFFSAGARSVIASHWQVEDEATAAMMGAFYDRLAADRSARFVDALRGARAALRADPKTSHPVFWAPFVIIGDGLRGVGAG